MTLILDGTRNCTPSLTRRLLAAQSQPQTSTPVKAASTCGSILSTLTTQSGKCAGTMAKDIMTREPLHQSSKARKSRSSAGKDRSCVCTSKMAHMSVLLASGHGATRTVHSWAAGLFLQLSRDFVGHGKLAIFSSVYYRTHAWLKNTKWSTNLHVHTSHSLARTVHCNYHNLSCYWLGRASQYKYCCR